MTDLEDFEFMAFPDLKEPKDRQRDLPDYCCMTDECFEESFEEE